MYLCVCVHGISPEVIPPGPPKAAAPFGHLFNDPNTHRLSMVADREAAYGITGGALGAPRCSWWWKCDVCVVEKYIIIVHYIYIIYKEL